MTRKKRKQYSAIVSDFDNFHKKIEDFKFAILESSFYRKLLLSLNESVETVNVGNVTHCICYGLGNFSSSVIARYQLALLLLLKDNFKFHVDIYDPAFVLVELDFLSKLNLNIIEQNEEGLRIVKSPTLMYMPHCPTALTNNFLWSNWQPSLSNCIVLGNSFKLLSETLTKHDLKTKYQCIYSILNVAREFQIENDFKYSDIFNDLSLHIFLPFELNKLSPSFWKNIDKPVYDDCDVECISKQMSEIVLETNENEVNIVK